MSADEPFTIVGDLVGVETIAAGPSVRARKRLNRAHGKGRWRKLKAFATVRTEGGELYRVELHWFEAHGIGKRDMKIKRFLDP